MSESELRDFVKYVQSMRASPVTFRAEVVKAAEKKEVQKRAQQSVGFDDLLD